MNKLSDRELIDILKNLRRGDASHPMAETVCQHFFGRKVPKSKGGFAIIEGKNFHHICWMGLKKMNRFIDLRRHGILPHSEMIDKEIDKMHFGL